MIYQRNVEIVSTKGLIIDLINRYSILNEAEHFYSDDL